MLIHADGLVKWAPAPMPRQTDMREVTAAEETFTGFVFKIQANMDPKHRDRVAFLRVVSGMYDKGMKTAPARKKDVVISDALTFMAGSFLMLSMLILVILLVRIITVPFKLEILLPSR